MTPNPQKPYRPLSELNFPYPLLCFYRSKSSTFLNTGSSRSHAVYTITLDRGIENGVVTQSVAFQLVDLAGAERG